MAAQPKYAADAALSEMGAALGAEIHKWSSRAIDLAEKLVRAEEERDRFREWWHADQAELKSLRAEQKVVALRPESA